MLKSRNLILLLCKTISGCLALCSALIFCAAVWDASEIGGLHLIINPGTVLPLAIAGAILVRR